MSTPQTPRPARYGPYHPYVPPRPPVPPSTGHGWTVVALLFCWPFALAALPHTLRASRALGAGDTRTAATEGSRARRLGIWGLAVGLSLSSVASVGLLVAATAATAPFIGAAVADAPPAPAPADGSGPEDGTPVRLAFIGNCYETDGLTDVVARIEVVDCDEPHGGEMYFKTSIYGDYRELGAERSIAFPGEAELARHATGACTEKLVALRTDPGLFDIWYIVPSERDWAAGNYSMWCFAEARDGSSTGAIAERASAE
ncbi:CD225/dispanin family protein [Myceligenerans indicum]|uniref:CD225/dispanin family protein n=1 Tax=Myceligenerans indicum TaxID=2593663 RepID=A0ABS1LI16_9MICO|nr:CD225/dispanin family protein [Myceligenerans indicum]MBL0885778.1 CD225/dispanin family protein [Myceligenerans indicum]